MTQRPTVVVGLDGATWRLLNRWINDGELPVLEKIRSNATWSVQRSCLPPVTSPNWKCYSTGKNPGKLGVYWWEIVDVEEQEIRIPDATDYNSAELFDYMEDASKSWAAVNMPTTFPPHGGGDNGIMISGGSGSSSGEYASPSDFKQELENRFDYKVTPDIDIYESGAVDEAIDIINSRFSVAKSLLSERDLEFLHLTIFLCNKFHHYFWDDKETLRVWKQIDRNLEWFVDRDLDLIFMSDHGSNEIESEFQLNVWLEKEGYLSRDSTTEQRDQVANRLGVTQRGLSEFAGRLGIRPLAQRIVPDKLINYLPKRGYKKEHKLDAIDWEQTGAIASGQGLVYLTDPQADGATEIRQEIAAKLTQLEDPITGRPVTSDVHLQEEAYSGSCKYAPDIIFDQSPGLHTEDMIGEYELFSEPSNWRGENERDGIFMAYGDSFDSRGKIEPTRIIDLAPTILHLHGLEIPEDIDGEVLTIFSEGTNPAERDPVFRAPLSSPWDHKSGKYQDSEAVEQRLQELGYLS
jgi:predicted AlkP superfamily phosphohydrolase/phosphomutase